MKYLLLIILLFLSTTMTAQQREVGDFTITDTEGNVLNLYDHLDEGYTVFIDLFYTTCTWCQYYSPIIEEIYQNTGAGQENILFWGISNHSFDTDSAIDQYKAEYGISNPCAGIEGNGPEAHDVVVDGQNFMGWPSYAVICPDRRIYFDPVFPPTVTGFNPYFEQCEAVSVDEFPKVDRMTGAADIYPNPASSGIHINLGPAWYSNVVVEILNSGGMVLKREALELQPGEMPIRFGVETLPSGIYLVRIRSDEKIIGTQKISIIRGW